MFRRNTIPQRKPFLLMKKEINEDIEKIYANEVQRNKLYYCLDEKPPQDNRFKKMEEFIKGNMELENVSDNLQKLTDNLEQLSNEINLQVKEIKSKSLKAIESK